MHKEIEILPPPPTPSAPPTPRSLPAPPSPPPSPDIAVAPANIVARVPTVLTFTGLGIGDNFTVVFLKFGTADCADAAVVANRDPNRGQSGRIAGGKVTITIGNDENEPADGRFKLCILTPEYDVKSALNSGDFRG